MTAPTPDTVQRIADELEQYCEDSDGSQYGTLSTSLVRDYINRLTAVEVGLLTFEGAFLGQMMLPTGRTILDELQSRSEFAAITGPTP